MNIDPNILSSDLRACHHFMGDSSKEKSSIKLLRSFRHSRKSLNWTPNSLIIHWKRWPVFVDHVQTTNMYSMFPRSCSHIDVIFIKCGSSSQKWRGFSNLSAESLDSFHIHVNIKSHKLASHRWNIQCRIGNQKQNQMNKDKKFNFVGIHGTNHFRWRVLLMVEISVGVSTFCIHTVLRKSPHCFFAFSWAVPQGNYCCL